MIEGVLSAVIRGGAQFSVSDSGTLLYIPGKVMGDNLPVTWIDGEGKTTVLRAEAADWWSPSFSPDGQQLAMTIGYGYATDVWTYDWARDTATQLTFGRGVDTSPVWTPDGRRIAYASAPDENTQSTSPPSSEAHQINPRRLHDILVLRIHCNLIVAPRCRSAGSTGRPRSHGFSVQSSVLLGPNA